MTRQKRQSRQLILDTAISVATEKGAGHVTLDAVAKASGLSKGGVLYHFPSKMALIDGLLQAMVDQSDNYKNQIDREASRLSQLEVVLRIRQKMQHEVSSQISMAILAAAAEQPDLLDALRERTTELVHNLREENHDPVQALIIWLAGEGLRFHQLLSLTHFDPTMTQALEDRLLQMAEKLK